MSGVPIPSRGPVLPRVAASLDPVIDFFNAGSNSGLPRPELRFTGHIRSGSRINGPVPPRRRAFLNVKFSAAMPQDCSSSFLSISDHCAGAPLPTTIPPFGFRRADKIATCRSMACLPQHVRRSPKRRPALEPRIARVAALGGDAGNVEAGLQHLHPPPQPASLRWLTFSVPLTINEERKPHRRRREPALICLMAQANDRPDPVTVGVTALAPPAKNAARAPSKRARAPNRAPRDTVLAVVSAACFACSLAWPTVSWYCCRYCST